MRKKLLWRTGEQPGSNEQVNSGKCAKVKH